MQRPFRIPNLAAIVVLVLGGAASAWASGPAAHSTTVSIALPPPVTMPSSALVKVASGRWDGHVWTLSGGDTKVGLACYLIAVKFRWKTVGLPSLARCSVLNDPPASSDEVSGGFAFTTISVCPLAFASGVTRRNVANVTVTTMGGGTVKTLAIVPPVGLSKGVRYFATKIGCGSRVSKVVGRDASGRIVAEWG